MSQLLRRYSNSSGSTPQGLEDRNDYDEDRNTAVLRQLSRSKSDLRRPSPMPASPRSSLSSPSGSPRAAPVRRSSGSWLPEAAIEETIEEVPEETLPSSSWSNRVDSALHNTPYEHDISGYKKGGYVPQHSIAGQQLNYRMQTVATGAVVPEPTRTGSGSSQ